MTKSSLIRALGNDTCASLHSPAQSKLCRRRTDRLCYFNECRIARDILIRSAVGFKRTPGCDVDVLDDHKYPHATKEGDMRLPSTNTMPVAPSSGGKGVLALGLRQG